MGQNRPHAAEPCEAHAILIDRLGGPVAVAEIIKRRLGYLTFTSQAVSMWKKRGIPYAYRACLAAEARELGIEVPSGFLGNEGEPPRTSDTAQPQPAA